MATGNASHTTPVQIMRVFMFYTNDAPIILIPVRVLLHGVY